MAKPDSPKSLQRTFRGLKKLVGHDNESIAVLAAQTLGVWGVAGRDEIAALKGDSHSGAVKHALAVALATTSSERYEKTLAELADTGDTQTRYAAVTGLAQANVTRGVQAAGKLLTEDPQAVDPVPLVKALLQHRKGGQLLGDELQSVIVHPAVKSRVSKFHHDSGLLPDRLADLFRPSATSASLSAELLAEDLDALTADVEKSGRSGQRRADLSPQSRRLARVAMRSDQPAP